MRILWADLVYSKLASIEVLVDENEAFSYIVSISKVGIWENKYDFSTKFNSTHEIVKFLPKNIPVFVVISSNKVLIVDSNADQLIQRKINTNNELIKLTATFNDQQYDIYSKIELLQRVKDQFSSLNLKIIGYTFSQYVTLKGFSFIQNKDSNLFDYVKSKVFKSNSNEEISTKELVIINIEQEEIPSSNVPSYLTCLLTRRDKNLVLIHENGSKFNIEELINKKVLSKLLIYFSSFTGLLLLVLIIGNLISFSSSTNNGNEEAIRQEKLKYIESISSNNRLAELKNNSYKEGKPIDKLVYLTLKDIPADVLLKKIQIFPIEEADSLVVNRNILISATTNKSISITNWATEIRKLDFVLGVTIENYENKSVMENSFNLNISLK